MRMLKVGAILALVVSGFSQNPALEQHRQSHEQLERNQRDLSIDETLDVIDARDRAIPEYGLAVHMNDVTEGAQAIAAGKARERATQADFTIDGSQAPAVRYLQAPKPLVKAIAQYSPEARIAELEGTVALAATVAMDGSARDLRVIEPLGIGLDEAAKAAAERWTFQPGTTGDGPAPMLATIELDFLLPSKQSRWHLLHVKFDTPEGASRPRFATAHYPPGAGFGPDTSDVARAIASLRKQALVTLSFVVDQAGQPVRFRVERASEAGWGRAAISFVSQWTFLPGMKDGSPVSIPCSVNLVWGDRIFTHDSLVRVQEGFEAAAIPH